MIELPIVSKEKRNPKPSWLKIELPTGENYTRVKRIVREHSLHTICEDGRCPNMGECWGSGTATFMILGNICTRSCSFCAVATGRPSHYDVDEPNRVAEAVKLMGVKHCVITSVNRDELQDKGSAVWADTITAVKRLNPETTIEALIPDFKANWDLLYKVLDAGAEVISHNMETVERLYRIVRPQAKYVRSLEQIKRTHEYSCRTKSGAMLGLGETDEEVKKLLNDLRDNGCDVLTLGQYLQPTKMHLSVHEFVHPEKFTYWEEVGLKMGFRFVESGPLVRSSYHAEKHVL
ncbi:MAG: lipoyl synthase [Flavobacteriaceae bacterium]|nr:lipoyl synthase [Flavobacteriaceae bacterium]